MLYELIDFNSPDSQPWDEEYAYLPREIALEHRIYRICHTLFDKQYFYGSKVFRQGYILSFYKRECHVVYILEQCEENGFYARVLR